MSIIRKDLISAARNRAYTLLDNDAHKDFHKGFEFMKQSILIDNSLTEEEKIEAIRLNNKDYDRDKILYNSGTRRTCENCEQKCLATLHCEYCVQNYLKDNFSNWASGNNDIDNLIKNCQIETLHPQMIVEWIPYNNLQDIVYLTTGGFSKIYTATWIDGRYKEWDTKEQKLIRFGRQVVVLKTLENVESASQNWFEEAKFHLTISNKYPVIVQCFGLTQNPSNGTYMLVMRRMDRNYSWTISDLGFCGPADKSLTSIYGNLPYIAPEIIIGKEYTFKSDIYSIAMLMWEISFGLPPFINYNHDYNLVIKIISGMRPKIRSEIPSEYKSLMEQCWDADPSKRPDIDTLLKKIIEIKSYYRNKPDELPPITEVLNKETSNNTSNKLFTSKIHKFENLPEPKNATEEEQEAFHSKPYDFNIPNNIDDFDKSSDQDRNNNSKIYNVIKVNSRDLYKEFKKLQINSENNIQSYYNRNTIQLSQSVDINDDDDIHNNPNFHSIEHDKLEIPDEDVLDHGLPSSNTNTSLIKQFLIEHDSSLIPILINLAENFSFYKVLHFYTDVPLSL
ncbi:kinase-like domain-containing protein [Rhizophagus clarus]|uniref:Kinase-like domain-containing protein n=1 Tax=Rhizophagus clarus TaxID=94130 RepID=A0A8H3QH70_9GLOM|nr:kinase-like domain-containing protein [Rhizophagus clarus]